MAKIIMNEHFRGMEMEFVISRAEANTRNKMLQDAQAKFGYDSPQYDAVRNLVQASEDEDEKYSVGEQKAYRAWSNTIENDSEAEVIVMDDLLFEDEVAGFVQALRNAGIKNFYYTSHSTAVMDNIHGFIAAGCTMIGTVVVERKAWRTKEQIRGLEFTV